MPTLARLLAEYAHSVRFDDFPPEVVREVKRRVLDSFGCALGAYDSDAGEIARRIAAAVPQAGGATLWGGRERVLAPLAAFANGVLVRYLDCNDTYLSLEPAHPSDNIPACIAAAESAGAGGRSLIEAIVVAYEIQCRMCDAASIRSRGWDHVTYGAFSTALAGGKLLGLNVDQLEQAVNLAGVTAAAMRQTRVGQLSMWKGCAFANSARNGLFAAWLAREGMTGPEAIFEGQMGFERQVSGPLRLDVSRFGSRSCPYMIMETAIKYWPAEYHSQSAIDAALQLRPQLGHPDEIERIEVHSFDAAVDIIGGEPEKWRPTSRETADHSLPYCVAAALVDGEITAAQFAPEKFGDPALHALMDRITIRRDPELTRRYPQGIPNRLVVTTKRGDRHELEVSHPPGHARNPMTNPQVEEKFASWAGRWMNPAQIDRVLETVWGLESLPQASAVLEPLVLGG